jgi:hypothetical protein
MTTSKMVAFLGNHVDKRFFLFKMSIHGIASGVNLVKWMHVGGSFLGYGLKFHNKPKNLFANSTISL